MNLPIGDFVYDYEHLNVCYPIICKKVVQNDNDSKS